MPSRGSSQSRDQTQVSCTAADSFFFIIFLFFKFYFIFKLYIIVLVLTNIKMNPSQVDTCSPSWTLLPPPSPSHPSGLSQCTNFECPVSCIELVLVICFIIYGNIHVSMLLSQSVPLSPSLTVSTSLFSMSESLFSSVAQSCPTLCDPMGCSTPGFHHQLLELAQTPV